MLIELIVLVRCGLVKWFLMKGKQSKWNDIGSQFIFFALNKELTVNVVSAKGQPVWEKTAELRFSLSKIWIWACLLFMSAYFNKHPSLLWAIVFCVPRALAFLEVVGGKGFKRWTPPKLGRLWIDKSAIVCFYESSSLHLWALSQSERERSSCSCWLAPVGLLSDCR